MTNSTSHPNAGDTLSPAAPIKLSLKAPIFFCLFTILAFILFVVDGNDGISQFVISTDSDSIKFAPIAIPSFMTAVVVTILMALLSLYTLWRNQQRKPFAFWQLIVFASLFLFGFLVWISNGASLPLISLISGSIALSAPLIFGALGGIVSERVGVVNIAIEGQLLAGAFMSAVIATMTGSPYLGLIGAMIAGMLVSALLNLFAIKYFVDQVIVGVVINVLVLGLTNFLASQVLAPNKELFNSPERFKAFSIPLLGDIPIIGPIFFQQTFIIYSMYIMVIAVYFGLFFTKWGLRLRAVGEHPKAADTVGIKVNKTRFWNVILAGAIAGFGGAFFTLGSVGAFDKEMTNGLGFIALAAVIFGRWHPLRATAAALLFGFTSNLQNIISVTGSQFPSEFLLMLPYVITVFAVAGFVGQSRGPAAAGKPY